VNIATPPIWKFGTEEQKQRWLVPAIKGEKIGALGITEPDAGSDVAGIRTHAKRVDGGYVVNGSKTFITNGVRADFVVTAVKTTPDGGHHGLSFLVLEKGMDGFTVSRKLEKLGWHASDTGELAFNDVFVPDENLLGEENKGFYLIMANFQWERLGMALGAVAKQFYLLERALQYVNERTAFGRPIGHFQVTRHKIAEIAVRAETGRALTYNALRLFVAGHDALRETTMAKLLTQRDCVKTADDVVQLFGGNGYMREYEVERSLRDARLGPIGGGSDEIMKEIIGRQLGL
jgi:acyl-CoA dehydrogenase